MKKTFAVVMFFGMFAFGGYAKAEQAPVDSQVDYQGQPPVDSDLDGLTDQAEVQIYHTDSKNADTDGDGYYDGAEVLAKSDPLDANSIPGLPSVNNLKASAQTETPWPWYVSRVSGLVGFALLYLSIFLGLTIRVPFLHKIFAPLYASQAHCWIALQATIFALVHGTVLVFDNFLGFNLIDVLVPFASNYKPGLIALGTIGFYLMVIITVSSYGRRHISQKLWRVLHFTNIILYFFVIAHAFLLGTDMKNDIIRNIFAYANMLLIVLMLINMFLRIRQIVARKNAVNVQNENSSMSS